jgi:hypothetical protein
VRIEEIIIIIILLLSIIKYINLSHMPGILARKSPQKKRGLFFLIKKIYLKERILA